MKNQPFTSSTSCCLVSLRKAKSQQDKRMWILHLKRLILENHPAKIPAKVRVVADNLARVHIAVVGRALSPALSICIPATHYFPAATAGLFLCSHFDLAVFASALDHLRVETFNGPYKKCFHVII